MYTFIYDEISILNQAIKKYIMAYLEKKFLYIYTNFGDR